MKFYADRKGKIMSTMFLFIAILGTAQAKKQKKDEAKEKTPVVESTVNAPTDGKSKKFDCYSSINEVV